MALFHLSVKQVKRSAGQSAVACAAYRAGEDLYSEFYGEHSDYTHKGGVVCSEILLPSYAPPEFSDRQTLWNAVERVEHGKKAQLAYSFDIALQNEFSLEENIAGGLKDGAGSDGAVREPGYGLRFCGSYAGQRGWRYPQPALSRSLPHSPAGRDWQVGEETAARVPAG